MLPPYSGLPGKNDPIAIALVCFFIGLISIILTCMDMPGPPHSLSDLFRGDIPYWVSGVFGTAFITMGIAVLLAHFRKRATAEKLIPAVLIQFALVLLWVASDKL